jgi:hypothetical protein
VDRGGLVSRESAGSILPASWEPGGDELTPTMKLKRQAITAKYADVIESLYAPGGRPISRGSAPRHSVLMNHVPLSAAIQKEGPAMNALIPFAAAGLFTAGATTGIIGVVTLAIRREEKNLTLTSAATDHVTRAGRWLNGVGVRAPLRPAASDRETTHA